MPTRKYLFIAEVEGKYLWKVPKTALRTISPACLPAGGHWQPGRAVLDRIKEFSAARRLLLLRKTARLRLAAD